MDEYVIFGITKCIECNILYVRNEINFPLLHEPGNYKFWCRKCLGMEKLKKEE